MRDVHISHYGRICPIETPEGTNIGLISSLSVYSKMDEYGFLTTPYLKVSKGKVSDGKAVYLRADQEEDRWLAPADAEVDSSGKLVGEMALARRNGEFKLISVKDVEFIDVSPRQMVGVSASLIPFLENDDANRALMGSNMMRQAVPLLKVQAPLVGTGMESEVARFSGMVVRAPKTGTVKQVDAKQITIGDSDPVQLRKFQGLNERTCLNQRPVVHVGDKVKAGDVIADGAAPKAGARALAIGVRLLVHALDRLDGAPQRRVAQLRAVRHLTERR